jgi:4a-hydroxytetrahydrobiopterin dehydratase
MRDVGHLGDMHPADPGIKAIRTGDHARLTTPDWVQLEDVGESRKHLTRSYAITLSAPSFDRLHDAQWCSGSTGGQRVRKAWTDLLKEALMALLDEETIARELSETPGWERAEDAIVTTVVLKDFKAAMVFVNGLAELAEAVDHHPDITIQWNKVILTLSTHSAGGLTEKDFDLARRISTL